jgi:hypothetical protein
LAIFTHAQTVAVNKNKVDEKTTVKVDQAAYDLLKNSRSTSQNLPLDFAGYSADVVYNENGVVYNGTIDYTPKVALKFELKGLAKADFDKLESDITSLISHRRGGDFAKGDGKYPITFGADDKNPIGRLVELNDEMKSSYRVRNNQVVQVNRTMGGEFFTINILETTPVTDGKYLPRQFTVTYMDDKTKAIKKTQFFTDAYENVEGAWLPKTRRIITVENGQTNVRLIEFQNFKVKAAAQAIK